MIKNTLFISALALSALTLAGSALAVKLINKDYSSYAIKINCKGSPSSTHIGASTQRDLGTGPCTVTLPSGASTTASGSQDIIIKNGGFSK